ncbi:MAG: DUF1566 domain-containing protein [Nitrospinota bacterium]|nr:DUF1566 domain-containing protein [Nitrospinota bacterium]
MDAFDNFSDNPSGVISDKQANLEWLPKDSYGDLGRWVNYQEALSYCGTMISVYAGGQNDWRLPTKDEALGLFHEDLNQLDWEGERVHIHPLFVTKCARLLWTSEENEKNQTIVVNFKDGSTQFMDKDHRDNVAARLVRSVK